MDIPPHADTWARRCAGALRRAVSSPRVVGVWVLVLAVILPALLPAFLPAADARSPTQRATAPAPDSGRPARLVVFVPTDLPGLHATEQGRAQGFYLDLLEALGRQAGLELELRSQAWPGPLEAVREGRGQVLGPIMGQPSAFTDLVHTEPLMRADWARYVRRGDSRTTRGVGYEGVRFATLSGVASRWLTRDYPQAQQVPVETIEEGLQAVMEGRADALLALKLPTRRVIARVKAIAVEEVGTELTAPMTLALAPAARAHVDALNTAIGALLASGETERLFKRWLEPAPLSAAEEVQERLLWALSGLVMVLLVLSLALWRANERLRRARQQAEQARQAKSNFLAVMSHEIRTPINGLVNLIDLLQRTRTTPEQADLLRQAELSNRSLLGLVNQVLDYSKIEASHLEFERHAVSLETVLKRVDAVLSAQPRAEGVTLVIEPLSADLPALWTDPERLVQVLVNLGGNALKFTTQGRVRVAVTALQGPTMSESSVPGPRIALRFEVQDTGPGIPEPEIDRLFQPFVQLKGGLDRPHGGTGLGLSTSQEIVRRMGSTIRVHSTPGVLTRFWFDLELQRAQEMPEAAVVAGGTGVGDGAGAGFRVMLVDDNPLNLLVTRKILEQEGCLVLQAGSAQQAMAILDEPDRPMPQLILMDLHMPEVDGIEAVARLRARWGWGLPPVLAVTGAVTEDAQAAAREAGMAGFVPKPFERATLLAAIAPFRS